MGRKRQWESTGPLAAEGEANSGAGSAEAISGTAAERLRRGFEVLGLTPYEARVMLALLRTGSATTQQLAVLADVPRSSTYQILEGLRAKQLADQLPVDGPAVWASPSRDEVVDRLEAAQEERLRQYQARATQLRDLLARDVPEAPSVSMPYVHILRGSSQSSLAYDDLLGEAKRELVMFTRPPYAAEVGTPRQPILDMLSRKVETRVLYQRDEVRAPEAEAWRQEVEAYHEAGVEARVVDELPIKLVVVDRSVALLAMSDPAASDGDGFPTGLLVRHPGFASVQADAFEQLWAEGRPYAESERPLRRRLPPERRRVVTSGDGSG